MVAPSVVKAEPITKHRLYGIFAGTSEASVGIAPKSDWANQKIDLDELERLRTEVVEMFRPERLPRDMEFMIQDNIRTAKEYKEIIRALLKE